VEQVAPTARVSSAGHGRGVGLVDGDVDGPTVGLDDGCSEDREQEISCVSKCDM